jgi:hypothetical protein
MTTPADRLYDLLPAVHRLRDAAQGGPLHALLAVIAEQFALVEDDIRRLYDDWFIETCQEWAIPYIGELVGFEPGAELAGGAPTGVLFPRAQVASTIGDRRRRGTLAVLEKLARDATGLPARAVEFSRLLAVAQSLPHLRLGRGATVDLRDADALDRLGGPFESTAHVVDTRGLTPRSALGRYGPAAVGVFLWRLRSVPVTMRQPYSQESVGPHAYTFSALGIDQPLFAGGRPGPASDELAVPAPLRRRVFGRRLDEVYGEGRDVQIWWVAPGGSPADPPPRTLVPRERIVVADLTSWAYRTPRGRVAVDPVLGRIAFPQSTTEQPRRGIWVSYRYGSAADLGGGEYERETALPGPETRPYRVGEGAPYRRLGQALRQWRSDGPRAAVIEVVDSAVYVEPCTVELDEGQSLELRAASGAAPVLRLLDWQTDQPDALTVVGGPGSCFTLDGFLVTGRGMRVAGDLAHLHIRHSTLVPGWGLYPDCRPRRPTEASVELDDVDTRVHVERSILGPIRVTHDEVYHDPVRIEVVDSVLDAMGPDAPAVSAFNGDTAHVELTLRRVTVLGGLCVHAVPLAENTIVTGRMRVARRQVGCVRFCSTAPGSRTPRRHGCQPDLVEAAVDAAVADGTVAPADRDALLASERLRVSPDFVSTAYGTPAYTQLAATCATEITTGADDGSEMGVHHDLFWPQRLATVHSRLRDSTPAGVDAAVILVN